MVSMVVSGREMIFLVLALLSVPGIRALCPEGCSCKNEFMKQTFDCSRNNLSLVPTEIDNDVEVLMVQENMMTSLQNGVFQQAGLQLSHNNIAKNAFKDLNQLSFLDLSFSNIELIDPYTFVQTIRLETLILRRNPVLQISSKFINSPSLNRLDLSFCNIKTLPNKSFSNVNNLGYLYLNGNELQKLENQTLEPLNDLVDLDLTDNPWSCYDCDDLCKLSDLEKKGKVRMKPPTCMKPKIVEGRITYEAKEHICSSANKVTFPPQEPITVGIWYPVALGFLTGAIVFAAATLAILLLTLRRKRYSIRQAYISSRKTHSCTGQTLLILNKTMASFLVLSTVVVLSMGAYANTNCSENCDCTSITEAKCTNKSEVPKDLSTDLEILSLKQCNISELEDNVFERKKLVHLAKLTIVSCNLQTVGKRAFHGLTHLKLIDLSSNRIRQLHIEVFNMNPQLSTLKLRYNPLNTTNDMFLCHAPSLLELDMSYCFIVNITDNYFNGLFNLTTLNLRNNNLKYLSVNVVHKLQHLQTLDLRYNEWSCSCSLKPLVDLYVEKFSLLKQPDCKEPFKSLWQNFTFHCPNEPGEMTTVSNLSEEETTLQYSTKSAVDTGNIVLNSTNQNVESAQYCESWHVATFILIGVVCILLGAIILIYKDKILSCCERKQSQEETRCERKQSQVETRCERKQSQEETPLQQMVVESGSGIKST